MSNQFAPLQTAALYNASSREIHQISQTRLKIRLSEHQSCVVIGTCTIWIKSGAVSICGARLRASEMAYFLSSPTSHALPAIEAVGDPAEFELASPETDLAGRGLQSLVDIGFPDVWTPRDSSAPAGLTFHVLDYHFQPDLLALRHARILETSNWDRIMDTLSGALKASSRPARFLVCGAPSCGTSTFAQNLLNRVFSEVGPDLGVAYIDLEALRPAFTPPGTICLQEVKTPVFGPPFSRPAANTGNVSKCHYVGSGSQLNPWYFASCLDLLQYANSKRAPDSLKPVIVHAPKWLMSLTTTNSPNLEDQKQRFWAAARPTHIISLGGAGSQFAESVPGSSEIVFQHIHQPPFTQFDLSRQKDMTLQAYFHLVFGRNGVRCFSSIPIMYDNEKTFQVSYGDFGLVKGVFLETDTIKAAYTNEAVLGKLAAIISVSEEGLSALGGQSTGESDALRQFGPSLSQSRLSPQDASFLGLVYIQQVSEAQLSMTVTTTIREETLRKPLRKHQDTHLILIVMSGKVDWLEKEASQL